MLLSRKGAKWDARPAIILTYKFSHNHQHVNQLRRVARTRKRTLQPAGI